MTPPEGVTVYTDGAARGNPGPAGAGASLEDSSGAVIAEVSQYLGEATNNQAEYRALILGLERAREIGAQEVEIRADSELMIRQMRGEYRVRDPELRELARRAHAIANGFASVAYVHVPRASNRRADRLANRAIDLEGEP